MRTLDGVAAHVDPTPRLPQRVGGGVEPTAAPVDGPRGDGVGMAGHEPSVNTRTGSRGAGGQPVRSGAGRSCARDRRRWSEPRRAGPAGTGRGPDRRAPARSAAGHGRRRVRTGRRTTGRPVSRVNNPGPWPSKADRAAGRRRTSALTYGAAAVPASALCRGGGATSRMMSRRAHAGRVKRRVRSADDLGPWRSTASTLTPPRASRCAGRRPCHDRGVRQPSRSPSTSRRFPPRTCTLSSPKPSGGSRNGRSSARPSSAPM